MNRDEGCDVTHTSFLRFLSDNDQFSGGIMFPHSCISYMELSLRFERTVGLCGDVTNIVQCSVFVVWQHFFCSVTWLNSSKFLDFYNNFWQPTNDLNKLFCFGSGYLSIRFHCLFKILSFSYTKLNYWLTNEFVKHITTACPLSTTVQTKLTRDSVCSQFCSRWPPTTDRVVLLKGMCHTFINDVQAWLGGDKNNPGNVEVRTLQSSWFPPPSIFVRGTPWFTDTLVYFLPRSSWWC